MVKNDRNSDVRSGLLLFAAVFVFFLLPDFLTPGFYLFDDNAVQFDTYYRYNYRSLFGGGELPLFNFHQFMGYAWFSQGQTAVFYLPAYAACFLADFFPARAGFEITLLIAFHLAAASFFMYFLLRGRGLSLKTALLLSCVWITLPFVCTVPRSWCMMTYVTAFLPLDFLILLQLMKKDENFKWLLLAGVRAFFFCSGYMQNFFNLFVLEIVFLAAAFLWKINRENSLRFFLKFFAGYIGSVLLAFPLFLSSVQGVFLSDKRSQGLGYENVVRYSLELPAFLKAQFFEFVSWGGAEGFGNQAIMMIFYIGVPLLSVLFFGIPEERRKALREKGGPVFLFAAAASLAYSTKMYGLLYWIPIFRMFRWPFKSFLFFAFFLILCCGLVYTSWPKGHKYRKILSGLFLISLLVNVGIFFHSDATLRTYFTPGELPELCREAADDSRYRCASAWVEGVSQTEAQRYLTFNNATREGLYHFAGYDPILSAKNAQYSLDINFLASISLTPEAGLLDYLSFCGVRYLIVPDEPEILEMLARQPRLRLKAVSENVAVVENPDALPVVRYRDAPAVPVNFSYGVNSLTAEAARGGTLEIAVTPVSGLNVYLDGIKRGRADSFPVKIEIPEGGGRVLLKYEEPYFLFGIVLAAAAWLCFAAAAVVFYKKYHRELSEK